MEYVCSLLNGGHREISITRIETPNENNAGFRVSWPQRRVYALFLATAWKDPLKAAIDYFNMCVNEYRDCYGDCFVIR